jgi:hypothetical protein
MSMNTTAPSINSTFATTAGDITALPAAVQQLLSLKGQIVTLTTAKVVKYRKDTPTAETVKVSTFQCRAGVNYDNLKTTKEGRENGSLPAENAGLNGVEWVQFPHLLRGIKSGKYLFRCTAFNGNPSKVVFMRGGVEIAKDAALIGALASELPKDEPSTVFNITVDNLTHINGVAV